MLLNETSLKELKVKAEKIGVTIVESEKWVLELCPTAAIPPDYVTMALLEHLGGKFDDLIKIAKLPEPLKSVLKRHLLSSITTANLSENDPDLTMQPSLEFHHSFDNSFDQFGNPLPGSGNPVLDSKLPGNKPMPLGAKNQPASFADQNGLRMLSAATMDRSIFEDAMVEVPQLYRQWLKDRYKKAGEIFDEFLRRTLSANPLLKDLKRSSSTDYDALPKDLKKFMEDNFRETWKRKGKSDADIDRDWAKAKFMGIRCDFMLTFKAQGPNGGTFSSCEIGHVRIGP